MKTFCITLPEKPQRRWRAEGHFREMEVGKVQFFNGINAERFGLKTVFNYEVDNPGSNFNMGQKPVGIFLSHYMLWSALIFLPETHFLILEDDAKFLPGWKPRFEQALKDTPEDFDLLFIGSCDCENKDRQQVGGDVFDLKYPMCLHAYMVAKKALPVMLQTQRKCYGPIDCTLVFHTYPKLKVYTVMPRLVEQFDTVISP